MVWPKVAQTFVSKISLFKILLLAFIVRVILLPLIYHGDVTTIYWWGKFASEFTWRGYYDWLNFGGYNHPDQPMLLIDYSFIIRQTYLFFYQILWFLNTHIPLFPSNFMTWYFLNGNQFLIKFPFVLTDITLIYLVYKFLHNKFAAILLALYLPLIYNSAVWGSGDSLINLLGLLSIYFLFQKKYLYFTLFFFSSVMFKPSLIIWSPLILIIFFKNRLNLKNIFTMLAIILFLIYLISRPFAITNPFVWFFGLMTQKILPGVMPQITSNAMNFWALFYGLVPKLDETIIFNLISVRGLSLIISAFLYLYISIRLYRHYSLKNLILALVQISLVTFTFMTRMHERYTFPALIPLFILCFYNQRFIKYFIILTLTHLFNVYHWWWFPQINFLISFLSLEPVIRLISLTNVILTISLLIDTKLIFPLKLPTTTKLK